MDKVETEYRECFVAFLDILGFKNIIKNNPFDEVKKIFVSIITGADVIKVLQMNEETDKMDEKVKHYNDSLDKSNIYIMSDSIVVSTPSEYKESLAVISDICTMIQVQLYSLDTPVLVRGAITKGEYYIGNGNDWKEDVDIVNSVYTEHSSKVTADRNTLVFGKGLVDAYLAQENYAIYPRIILPKYLLKEYVISVNLRHELPEDEEDGYCYLDTLHWYLAQDIDKEENKDIGEPIKYYSDKFEKTEPRKRFIEFLEKNLSVYNDINIRKKYVWLRREVERLKRNYLSKHGIEDMKNMTIVTTTSEVYSQIDFEDA